MPSLPTSMQQRVICLVFVDRARLGLEAGDQTKAFDRQRVGPELRMRGEKAGELVERWLMEPRQGDVRREFARLRCQSDANQRLLDLVAQCNQLGGALDPYPKAPRFVAAAENAGSGELQGEAAGPQSSQRLVDFGCDVLRGLADETQGQVEITGIHPSCPVDPRAQRRQPQPELRRKADTDKKPQHHSDCNPPAGWSGE